jgi:hypothetical protein
MSADQGNPAGQCNYGDCLENGKGVFQDLRAAAIYYKMFPFLKAILWINDQHWRSNRSNRNGGYAHCSFGAGQLSSDGTTRRQDSVQHRNNVALPVELLTTESTIASIVSASYHSLSFSYM